MASQQSLTGSPSTTDAINRQVLTVSPETPIAEVVRLMSSGQSSSRASCAVVVDESNNVVGIVTERDVVNLTAKQYRKTQALSTEPISTLMTTSVKTLSLDAFQDIFAVLFLFRRYRIRHLPIVDTNNQLVGVVTPASIRNVLKPANLLKLRRVSDIMVTKVVRAPANASVIFLAQMMAQYRVSCVVITEAIAPNNNPPSPDEGPPIHPPVGIVTERDIVQFKALNLDLHQLKAQDVMSAPLFLLDPQDSLWTASESMRKHKVRRLVVSWNWGKGLGIITQTSLLKVFDPIEMYSVIDSLQQTVKQMKAESGLEPEGADEQSDLEPSQETSVQALLAQAVDCLAIASNNPQLTSAQKPLLQQAIQLIQQISD